MNSTYLHVRVFASEQELDQHCVPPVQYRPVQSTPEIDKCI